MEPAQTKKIDTEFYIEGYATTWESYPLFEDEKGQVFEKFSRDAFNGCDMSDIIFQYDHEGRVFARQSNGTLIVYPDDVGLFVAADLSKTAASREIFEDIRTGLTTKMSWGFLPGEVEFDRKTRTIIHRSVKKIFDVSIVSIPANQNTEVYARAWADGVISPALEEFQRHNLQRRRLLLKLKMEDLTR